MLAEGKNMNIFTKTSQIIWDEEEWNLVAAELKRQNPKRNTESFGRIEFSAMELEDAAEVVLPQERVRTYESFDVIRRSLFTAFERNKKNPIPKIGIMEGRITSAGHVEWSDEEYTAIIYELYRLDPNHFEDGCKSINITAIRTAMLILEPHRRRVFKQLVTFRETMVRKWAKMPPVHNPTANLAKVEFASGVIVEPKPRKSDGYNSVASAMHAAFKAPSPPPPPQEKPKQRKTKVLWSPADWVLIAREMRRQNPHLNFFASKFSIIDLPALREAQRIFPLEHRKVLSGSLGLQAPLVQAFIDLRAELQREREDEDKANPYEPEPAIVDAGPAEIVLEPVPEAKAASVAPVIWPVERQQIMQSAPPEYRDSTDTDFIAAVTNAAVPFMKLLISEVTKNLASAMIPQLSEAIRIALESAKPAPVAAAAPVAPVAPVVETVAPVAPAAASEHVAVVPPEAPPRMTAAAVAAFNGITATTTKKTKIAMLGPMGKQITDIEQAYPDYKFIFIQNNHGIKEAALACDLFIAYTSHTNAHAKKELKRFIKDEKLRRIDGSLTSVKRQLDIWEASKNG